MYKARCDSLLLLHHANKRAVAHVGQGRRGAGGFRTPPQVPEGRLLSLATDTHWQNAAHGAHAPSPCPAGGTALSPCSSLLKTEMNLVSDSIPERLDSGCRRLGGLAQQAAQRSLLVLCYLMHRRASQKPLIFPHLSGWLPPDSVAAALPSRRHSARSVCAASGTTTVYSRRMARDSSAGSPGSEPPSCASAVTAAGVVASRPKSSSTAQSYTKPGFASRAK